MATADAAWFVFRIVENQAYTSGADSISNLVFWYLFNARKMIPTICLERELRINCSATWKRSAWMRSLSMCSPCRTPETLQFGIIATIRAPCREARIRTMRSYGEGRTGRAARTRDADPSVVMLTTAPLRVIRSSGEVEATQRNIGGAK